VTNGKVVGGVFDGMECIIDTDTKILPFFELQVSAADLRQNPLLTYYV